LDLLIRAKQELDSALTLVVLASPTFPADPGIASALLDAGVRVHREYTTEIGDIYRAADLYLFPVDSSQAGAIELPLSVLEAVHCGLPVLTTEYGALPEALKDVPGVNFTSRARFVNDLAALVLSWPQAQLRTELPSSLSITNTHNALLGCLQ
jgi:glycosyltransferase involved in cell wall biosynthesis